MPKEIILTRGHIALVDDWNYEWLNAYKWHEVRGYAMSGVWSAYLGRPVQLNMSRLVLGLEQGDSRQADHINHNKADNRECNLRVCTNTENQHNQKVRTGYSSRFKGVYWKKDKGKWYSQITFEGKALYLGSYYLEEDAARAYDEAALRLFGTFSNTNF